MKRFAPWGLLGAALIAASWAAVTPRAHASPRQQPVLAEVSLRIPAASLVATSNVVRKKGGPWFAVAIDDELRIYRWHQDQWVLDGTVDLPPLMPVPGAPGGELRSTSITGSDAPDFTAHAWRADTAWFAIAARTRGRWRIVPFDDQFGARHLWTFAYGAQHHLILGGFDPCGCASGPTTNQWYRFTNGIFAATSPPGPPAVCSASALAAANHWPPLPYDPLVRGVARPFRVVRYACADGWALATDGHKIGVYEQHGRHLNDQVGRNWLRVGVGTPRLVGTRADFAMPRSLLNRLGSSIGVRFPPAPLQPASSVSPRRTSWQRAAILVRLRPGDSYATSDLFDGRPKILTVTITSRTSGKSVMRFRWHDGGWVRI
jgi:hypothetical protein